MMYHANYESYLHEVDVNWGHIRWVTDILSELVDDGVLPREDAQNLSDSLYYGEHWKDFKDKDCTGVITEGDT